jgi:hypothetical protein
MGTADVKVGGAANLGWQCRGMQDQAVTHSRSRVALLGAVAVYGLICISQVPLIC